MTAMMSDTVVLTGISPDTPREILINHLTTVTRGKGYIQFLLHPFINDATTAVVKFNTTQAVHDVIIHPNIINGAKVIAKMLPPQVYGRCHAVIDSFVVACLPNLKRNTQSLKDLGVELEANVKTGEVRMTGSLLQLQCAQHALHQMMLNQVESQERKLIFGLSHDDPRASTARSSMDSTRSSVADMEILQSITARSLDLGPNMTSAQFQRLTQSGPSAMHTTAPDYRPYTAINSTQGSTFRNSHNSSISETLRQSSTSTKSSYLSSQNSMDFSTTLAEVDKDKLEVDSLVFDYIVLKHSDQVLAIEDNNGVKLKYKRNGETTTILVAPYVEEPSNDIKGAKEQLITLYKAIFFSVKKEVIAVDPETIRRDLFKKVINQVKQDYVEDLIVVQPTDYSLLLLGKNFYVTAATQYLKKMLGGKVRSMRDERRVQTAREDKPKMVYMMHSAPVSPIPSSSPPGPSKSTSSTLRSTGRTKSIEDMSGLIVTGKPAASPRSSLSRSGSLRNSLRSSGGSLRSSSGSLRASLRRSDNSDKMFKKTKGGQPKRGQGTEVFFDSLDPRQAALIGQSAAVVSQDMLQSVLLGKQVGNGNGSNVAFEFETPGNIKISVETGNIIDQEVDMVVNPAREDLHLLNGISEVISEAAGSVMQKECTQHVAKHGNMKVSEVMHTEATGLLKCYFVLHAVGPMWCLYTNKDKCHEDLKDTYLNCLIYAQDILKAKSVAFPAVGTGMFGIPLGVCCQAAYTAIQEYDVLNDWKPFVKEIRFVHQDEKMTTVMTAIFQGLLHENEGAPLAPDPSLVDIFENTSNGDAINTRGSYESARSSMNGDVTDVRQSLRPMTFQQQEVESIINSARSISSQKSRTEQKESLEDGFDTLVAKQVSKWAMPSTSLNESEEFNDIPRTPFRQNEDTWNEFISGNSEAETNGNEENGDNEPHEVNEAQEDVVMNFSTDKEDTNNDSFQSTHTYTLKSTRQEEEEHNEENPGLRMSSIDDSPPNSDRSDKVKSSRSEGRTSRSEKGRKTRSKSKRTKDGDRTDRSIRSSLSDKKGSGRIAASLWSQRSHDLEDSSDLGNEPEGQGLDSNRSTRSQGQGHAYNDAKASIESGTLTRLFHENYSARTQDSEYSDVPARLATPDVPASPGSFREPITRSRLEDFDTNGAQDPEEDEIITQPANGRMLFEVNRKLRLPGYEDVGTIVITYDFPSGKTQGIPYNSAAFQAYLPYNQDGRTVLTGLRKAFEDLRTFVVHRNGTRGLVTWADVEHKTSLEENNEFGFPDDEYLQRIKFWLIEEGYG